ncbi:MAG TPA: hypothetical protein VN380_10280 [Thermoanaerobaculia bacterium]|jgi:hypothetical protein|nr:hypothetical protein [Thermoanaerobaculia bacterium]
MMHNATAMTESLQSVAPAGLQRNVPLAALTTLGIGRTAKLFARVEGIDEIHEVIAWTDARREPLFILGGSNVLIADNGFDGVVLQIDPRGMTVLTDPDAVKVYLAAGELTGAIRQSAYSSRRELIAAQSKVATKRHLRDEMPHSADQKILNAGHRDVTYANLLFECVATTHRTYANAPFDVN